MKRRVARGVLFTAAFALSLAGVLSSIHSALEAAEVSSPAVGMEAMLMLDDRLSDIRGSGRAFDIAYLGDSTVVKYPPEHRLPKRLQEELGRPKPGGRPFAVHSLATMGLTPYDFYFVADAVIEAGTDLVILPFNLAAFSWSWRGRFPRPELSSWIRPGRIVEAALLPVHDIGLTMDRLLFYRGVERSIGLEAWHFFVREQARVGRGRQDLELWASSFQDPNAISAFRRRYYLGLGSRIRIRKAKRFNELGHANNHGGAFAGQDLSHPVIRIFDAALGALRDAEVPVLVYVVPLNYEHCAKLGLFDEAGLAQTLATLEEVARRNGARFLDLHRLLPDAGFVDAPGHFRYEDGIDGPRRVAAALAPAVLAEASRSAGKAD
ncbi:MAG: hypothetical protein JRG96_09785 [Deltaproteobacteria bacterium]|nr:hypothetical protein [Deltaproteobacteria bacterium]MBW2419025.1 hypothetical protein [Deltaproteobacteria bacterium]